ncbi:aspartate--tRNA ligase [Bacillus horti]|uniref:Aspartate--tRNA(Asp/Asn) ligase n=1 Tax=Caldalkalibacillus horti TaxID=77523 RepID=A0ABT9VTC2_9BACI|nr:aspartate--tRNA ligase [Bacillus horti]MDQ0164232.1 aspartyl-tRNA synthetase [Bacillus horti]
MGIGRTHHCGILRKEHIGQEVQLNGWVNKRRDLGGLIFIDLRDRSGLVQIVFHPEHAQALELAEKVRNEYVLAIKGQVVARAEGTVNSKMGTGDIEVNVTEIEVINASKGLPFMIQDDIEVDESIRLKYRYLDLRRPEMQQTIMLRHKAYKVVRDFLDEHQFLEVETPFLTKSTPEGARDYLVPSRVHHGEFYALPQSPQLFKQLLMVGGFERYFQIARCFRDEDLRADRQPEFTQIDIETAFMSLEEIQSLVEQMMAELVEKTIGVKVSLPIERMSYAEAMEKYGSDKPDLRFSMELVDISELVQDSSFKVFSGAVANGGQVKAIVAKGCAHYSRKDVDQLGEYVGRYGAKGLAWLALKEGEVKGSIAKFFEGDQLEQLKKALHAEEGDLLLFVADSKSVVASALGALRLKLGKDLGLINENEYKFAWITEFPMFEYDEEAGRYVAAHHPFTMPLEEDIHLFETDPSSMRAQAYDLVLNGYELSSGSMRIYKREIQEKVFKALGLSEEEAKEKFGFLLEAFEYGTPPHGGLALGFDRIIMLLAKRTNLRETIAFPKTASATDVLTDAPGAVDDKQLKELNLQILQKEKV